uniref:Uncharacterized protein n=1 Tax=Cucumis melo TaxID=3656 RepID=A0A9I9EKB5_CUCME
MVHQSRQTQVATPRDGPSSRLRISIRMSRSSLIRNFRFFSFCSEAETVVEFSLCIFQDFRHVSVCVDCGPSLNIVYWTPIMNHQFLFSAISNYGFLKC